MKTIGLLGGMSWESTVTYYQIINETVMKELGGLHSAKILMYSVDFEEIERYQSSGEWDKSAAVLSDAAQRLEQAGADFIVLCTNTMHKVVPGIQSSIKIPLLHIAEVTAQKLKEYGIQKVGLLGTKYTMTQDFYKKKLEEAGIEVLIPDASAIDTINRIIFDELCVGKIRDSSKRVFLRSIGWLRNRGAKGVILGCTEIGLLIHPEDVDMPIFDTALIHAKAAAYAAME